jgi:hypothetical protein
MESRTYKPATLIAAGYLLLTAAVASPLIFEGYIGHGNGVAFLAATVLTSPLSFALFLLNDVLAETNAFYMTGWPYFITLGELAAGALLNALVIYLAVTYARRKWQKPRG